MAEFGILVLVLVGRKVCKGSKGGGGAVKRWLNLWRKQNPSLWNALERLDEDGSKFHKDVRVFFWKIYMSDAHPILFRDDCIIYSCATFWDFSFDGYWMRPLWWMSHDFNIHIYNLPHMHITAQGSFFFFFFHLTNFYFRFLYTLRPPSFTYPHP